MNLHVDGIPGEDTLMQLMRDTNTTPSVLIRPLMPHRTRKRRRSIPNVYHLSCGPAQLRFRGGGLVFVPHSPPEKNRF
jgi:general secretion pathway protein A